MKTALKHWYLNSGGSGFSSQYQAILTQASSVGATQPGAAQKIKDNAFLETIVSDGLFDKALLGYMFKTDGDFSFTKICWKNPSTRVAVDPAAPATFTANSGITSNGTTSYLRSSFLMSELTQDSVTYCFKVITNSALGNQTAFGCGATNIGSPPQIFSNVRNASYNNTWAIGGANVTTAETSGNSRFALARDGGNVHRSKDGGAFSTAAVADSAINGAKEIYLLAFNGSSVAGYETRGLQYFWIFNDKLSDTEISNFDSAISTWLS